MAADVCILVTCCIFQMCSQVHFYGHMLTSSYTQDIIHCQHSGMFWKLVLLLSSDKRVELDFIVYLIDGKDV